MLLPEVFVGIRDPSRNYMDASRLVGTNVTLSAGATFTCTATKTLPSAVTYIWWADYQSSDLVYPQLSIYGNIVFVG